MIFIQPIAGSRDTKIGATGTLAWWYWLTLAGLLLLDLCGFAGALWLAAGLAWFQVVHFRSRSGAWSAFPVQVRAAYASILSVGLLTPAHAIVVVPAIGTPAQVLVGYCALARALSLMPWNRRQPLSLALVWTTFVSRPRAGNVLQGQEPLARSRVEALRTQLRPEVRPAAAPQLESSPRARAA